MVMKKTLIIFMLLAIVCFSCNQSNTTQTKKQTPGIYQGDIKEYVYDGHEYVVFGGGQWGGHKGNCKFCRQERKGVSIPLSDIENIIKDKGGDKISVELIKVGKMSDESEFLTIKIKVKK